MDENPSKRSVGRPRKSPTPIEKNFFAGQLDVEPGDNSKYLGHALTISRLPLVDLNDVKAVEERVQLYFELCFKADMKPTVTGLCNALSVRRNTIMTWKRGEVRTKPYQDIILRAYDIMESLWEDYMLNGKINPVSGIFLGKNNFGYQDKQDIVVTPNTNIVEPTDVATVEAKYAELPDVEE